MLFLKRIVLFFLLLLSPIALAAPSFSGPSEIQTIPPGQWKSVTIQKNKEKISSLAVRLFSYKNKIVLFEFIEKSRSCFSVNNQSDYLSIGVPNLCDKEELVIDKLYLDKDQLELVSGDTHYFFLKETAQPVSRNELSAVWEWEDQDSKEAYAINIYPDGNVIFTDPAEAGNHLARLFITGDNLSYIVLDDVFVPVFYHRSRLDVIADERRTFKRTNKKLPSQFMMDENGLPVVIDHFAVNTKVSGDLAETTIDIHFKTLESRDAEVAFRLPLPASASVSGYSLDVDKRMVPAVVVMKEEARDVLETLESRGVDPAVAEVTQNNQFQTEIYPVSKDNPRQIQIQYQEVLQEVNGKYRYSIPLDALGEFAHFSFVIELEGVDGLSVSPQSAISQKQLKKYKTSKGKIIGQFSTDNFSASSELTLTVKPEKKLALQVQSGTDENVYFRLPLNVDATPFKPNDILVLWDNSLSMHSHHAQYVAWLSAVRRKFPNATIKVQLFSTHTLHPVDLARSADALKLFAETIVYDGASNMNAIKDLINEQQDETVVLFSDAVHSMGLLDLKDAQTPIYAVYPNHKTSNMPLLEALSAKGNLASVDDLATASQKAFFSILPTVETSAGDDIIVQRRFGAKEPIAILGMLNKAELPYRLAVKVNGAAKEFLIDDESLVNGNSIQYLWANNKIQPLLVNPKQHKQAIIDTGMRYSIVTPYTSFLVLEDLDDYVEFGIKPPASFDPEDDFEEQRREYLAEQADIKKREERELLAEWKTRVKWYKNPVAFNKFFLKENKANNNSSSSEEVVVTGARASASDDAQVEEVVVDNFGALSGSIKIAAWQPDTPYMIAIRAVSLDMAYDTYLKQRNEYASNLSFYMDVAKYFFDKQQPETGYKILSNISEIMPEKILAQRLVAYTLVEYQQWASALSYLHFINEIVPHEATSKRDLAVLLERMASPQAPDLITQSANYYWQAIQLDDGFQHDLAITSLGELNNLITRWQLDPNKIAGFDKRFVYAMEFDLRVVISWTNDQADMDLHIYEPDKTEIYYLNPYSRLGAWLPFDNTSGFGPEEYLLKSAKKGVYKVAADFYSNNAVEAYGPVTVHVDIYRNYGRKNQVHKTTTVRLDNTKDILDLAEIIVE